MTITAVLPLRLDGNHSLIKASKNKKFMNHIGVWLLKS